MKKTVVLSLLLCAALSSCGQQEVAQAPSDEQSSARTRVLTQWAGETLKSQGDDGTLVFDVPAQLPLRSQALSPYKIDAATELKTGDIVVSAPTEAAPYGTLAEVTSVNTQLMPGGMRQVTLSTKPATVESALANANVAAGDYNITAEGDGGQATVLYDPSVIDLRTNAYVPPKNLNPIPPTRPIDMLNAPLKPMATYPLLSKDFCFNKTVINAQGVSAFVNGCASINTSASLNLKWSFLRIQQLEARVDGGISAQGALSASATWSAGKNIVLASYAMPTKVFWVGPVPIVITPRYDLILDVNGSISAQASLSTSASAYGSIGAIYNRGAGWSPVNTFSTNFTPPAFSSSVSMNAGATLNNRAGLYFYGVVGFGAYASPYVNMNYMPFQPAGSRGNLQAGIRGGVDFDASRIIPNLTYNQQLFDKVLYSRNF